MFKRNLLKVIQQLDNALASPSAYDPEGLWYCDWEETCGSGGTLDECIDMVSGYIDSTERKKHCRCKKDCTNGECPSWGKIRNQVKTQCLATGKARGLDNFGGEWWSIYWGENEYQ